MLKNDCKCPNCGSTEIYRNKGRNFGYRGTIHIDFWTAFFVKVYVCVDCGYSEEYIEDKHLKDQKRMGKIKSKWQKHTNVD